MRSSRTALIALLAVAILAAPLAGEAQPGGKVWRIGVLRLASPPDPYVDGFRRGLHDLGYVEGRDVVLEYRWAAGRLEQLADLAAELAGLQVDVIVAGGGTPAVQAAKRATSTIPIVVPGVADPVRSGLVASLSHPGGNVTGLALPTTDLDAGRLRLLKEVIPRLSRVAVLWNPPHPLHGSALNELSVVARALGIQIQPLEVWAPEHFGIAFAATGQGYAEAVLVLASPMHYLRLRQIADLAIKHRLPAAADFMEFAEAGGLMAYGPSLPDLYRRAATYVDKIFKGAKPSDLPFEQPTKFQLIINLRTAQALGLTIPKSVLVRADHVIEWAGTSVRTRGVVPDAP